MGRSATQQIGLFRLPFHSALNVPKMGTLQILQAVCASTSSPWVQTFLLISNLSLPSFGCIDNSLTQTPFPVNSSRGHIPTSTGEIQAPWSPHPLSQHTIHAPRSCPSSSNAGAPASPGGAIHSHQQIALSLPSPFTLFSCSRAWLCLFSCFSSYQYLVTSCTAGILEGLHKGTDTSKSNHPRSYQHI